MRKSFVALLLTIALLVLVAVFQFTRSNSITAGKPQGTEVRSEESAVLAPTPQAGGWAKPTRTQLPAARAETTPSGPSNGAADFSRGETQNIVVSGGIRLGSDPTFIPRFNPKYKLFGNYIAPEQVASEPFDSVNVNMEVSSLDNNEVIFEIRTRPRVGEWSEWREVTPEQMREPVSVGANSIAWQFRTTLLGNDSATGPKVETVSVEPLGNPQNLSSNNAR